MKKRSVDELLRLCGLFNIFSPFSFLLFTATWGLFVMFLFGFNDASIAANILAAFPLVLCPISCILGFLFGWKHRIENRKRAMLCMGLSAAGFVEYILLFLMVAFLGSIG